MKTRSARPRVAVGLLVAAALVSLGETARAANTADQVCQRWVCDRADMSEGVSTGSVADRSLATVGGKGLFVKELETAMLEGRADLAVHSMKDVPALLPPGLCLGAFLPGEDPRDALVSNSHASLDALPAGAVVGSSSLRRQAQLRALRPDLELRELRGNVGTRLRKLDEGRYDAIILAHAGLQRLGLPGRIRQSFDVETFVPAIAQGVIGIECREDDAATRQRLAPLHHAEIGRASCRERV